MLSSLLNLVASRRGERSLVGEEVCPTDWAQQGGQLDGKWSFKYNLELDGIGVVANFARFSIYHKPGTLQKEQLSSFQRVKCIATSREVEKEKGFHSYPAEQ